MFLKKKLFSKINESGIKFIFLGTLLGAVSALLYKYTIQFFDVMVFSAIICIIPGIFFLMLFLKSDISVKNTLKYNCIPIILIAISMVFGLIFEGYAYLAPGGDVSLVKTIISLSSLFAMFGAIIFLKEKTYITRRLIGASIMILSIAVILGVFT